MFPTVFGNVPNKIVFLVSAPTGTAQKGGSKSREYDSSARRVAFASARRSIPHDLASGLAAFSIQRRLDWLARWATIEMGDDAMRRGD